MLRDPYGHVDSTMLSSVQSPSIGLNVGHDPNETCGHVEHLELRESEELWAIAVAYGPRARRGDALLATDPTPFR